MGDKPAFPQTIDDMATIRSVTQGMSLREYAAIHAMQGILASPDKVYPTPDGIARDAVKAADALLEQLDGGK